MIASRTRLTACHDHVEYCLLTREFAPCINSSIIYVHLLTHFSNVAYNIRFVTFVTADTPEIRCSVHPLVECVAIGLQATL